MSNPVNYDTWQSIRQAIQAKQLRCDYAKLPQSFEYDAVKNLYSNYRQWFATHNIRSRVLASKAQTFQQLLDAIDKAQNEDIKKFSSLER